MSDLAVWKMDLPPVRVEPTPRWIRVRVGDTVVADSRQAQLLVWFGPGMLPTYCFPAEDVRIDLLLAPDKPAQGGPGSADFLVDHDIRTDDLLVERGAQRFQDPPEPFRSLADHWTFTWDDRVRWFEEALEIHVHAKDPTKRVDAVPSERHIRVEIDGEAVAESHRPHALFETDLPTRWYLPSEDVRPELLVWSDTVSRCPYKGTANYWSVRVGETLHTDVAWTYPEPIVECPRVAGLVAFFNEKVDLIVDGILQPRPQTPWSS